MDDRMFIGYKIYYRIVPHDAIGNVSILDNRDACHDSWQMHLEDKTERGTMIKNLQADTWYALYIETLIINSPGAKGGISEVVYCIFPISTLPK